MKYIDYFLDRITMYRLVLYYLIALLALAAGLGIFKVINYNPLAIAFSAGYLTLICWAANSLFASVFETPANTESVFITALILALIIAPYHNPHDLLFLTAAGGLAIASKFILAIRKKHIFNPAAVAVLLLSFGAGQSANWWVGSAPLLPLVIVGGILIVRKINRSAMVWSYLTAAIGTSLLIDILTKHAVLVDLHKLLLHSALFFLAFIMLTEPLTSPATQEMQIWYGILVGLLFSPQVHIGSIYTTPELTLIVGNIFAYLVSPKYKLLPRLKQKLRIAPNIVDFVFVPERALAYKPGQYMEWTIAHQAVDSRGNRRYLTLASSPTEADLRLGVKFYPKGSTYKRAMLALNDKSAVAAGQLGGDFTLDDNPNQKLAFIAGGIGITPFRSMVKYISDTGQQRDVVLIYSERSESDLVYRQVFSEGRTKFNLRTVYTLTDLDKIRPGWPGQIGIISGQLIQEEIPDFLDRIFYVSGPQPMVQAVKHSLHKLGVAHNHIKTDLFPGYA
ncbi:MAG: RnfABCDGE type electron transport complex subunit D [Candidatus Saccharimonadales bacterium]